MTKFYHFNFNVLDLDRSLAFYKQALNLTPVREKEGADGSFKLVYLGDGVSEFTLQAGLPGGRGRQRFHPGADLAPGPDHTL